MLGAPARACEPRRGPRVALHARLARAARAGRGAVAAARSPGRAVVRLRPAARSSAMAAPCRRHDRTGLTRGECQRASTWDGASAPASARHHRSPAVGARRWRVGRVSRRRRVVPPPARGREAARARARACRAVVARRRVHVAGRRTAPGSRRGHRGDGCGRRSQRLSRVARRGGGEHRACSPRRRSASAGTTSSRACPNAASAAWRSRQRCRRWASSSGCRRHPSDRAMSPSGWGTPRSSRHGSDAFSRSSVSAPASCGGCTHERRASSAGEPHLDNTWATVERRVGEGDAARVTGPDLQPLADGVFYEGGAAEDANRPPHRRYLRVDTAAGTGYQALLAIADMPREFFFPDGGRRVVPPSRRPGVRRRLVRTSHGRAERGRAGPSAPAGPPARQPVRGA